MDINIMDYGAVVSADLQTKIIQKAIDDCFLAGGGTVIIPAGIFRTGGIRLRSNVTLYLKSGAMLEASDDPEDYFAYRDDKTEPVDIDEPLGLSEKVKVTASVNPYSRWNNGIIRAIKAENVAIIGEENSYIDGVDCYDAEGEEGYRGPHAINMYKCKNITLKGYTVRRSGNWTHNIYNSRNIAAENITVYGGHDGFDVRTCDNIRIENCSFYTGDDCIAGFDNTEVVIRNCIFNSSCSALRFGGTNVLVENCKGFSPGRFPFRGGLTPEQKKSGAPSGCAPKRLTHTAFRYYCDFRAEIRQTPENITIRNCEFDNVKTLFQMLFDGKHIWCTNRPLKEITYENCVFKNISEPIQLYGAAEDPISIKFKNTKIEVKEEAVPFEFMNAANYSLIEFENVEFVNFEPEIICYTDGEIAEKNCNKKILLKKEEDIGVFQNKIACIW